MTYNSKLSQDIQNPAVGKLIKLYIIDATSLGAVSKWHFCEYIDDGSALVFNNNTYIPIPLQIEGEQQSAVGVLPRPLISLSNVNNTIASEIELYNDLIGATVEVFQTLYKYVDGQPEADNSAVFPKRRYIINSKKLQNKEIIQFELRNMVDIEGLQLPKRKIIRDYCNRTYRVFQNGSFVYGNCPYNGSNYFDKDGNITTIENDYCARKLSDCRLRYPNNSDSLPTWACPMVARNR